MSASPHTRNVVLPPPPSSEAGHAVAAWSQPITIDTYLPESPHPFPAYLDGRVYQGSSGRVFPLPFHERISTTPSRVSWEAIHLENEWIRLVVLPQLGGRIYVGYDKTADYDFFYRNNVIKPALVGLTGPWASGGVEFNWPQHHRPATFLPTDVEIERHDDGSVTVWCSDHDPFERMKGMHGIRLSADSSRIEARVKLYNRSDVRQSFLWWSNIAVAVNDDYQSFFPPDVEYVADHARRAITAFPKADRLYYGVDYPVRVDAEHPDADRIDWYRNIPVPTSYMVLETEQEFFGGYDHHRDAGFVHWAPREISPGKKQWTWGDAEFGRSWGRNLTDHDGPYVELMAGVFTDNQPDFAWLHPGETKSFSQYWYPVHHTGPITHANDHVAARFTPEGSGTELRVLSCASMPGATLRLLDSGGAEIIARTVELMPNEAHVLTATMAAGAFEIVVAGKVVLEGTTGSRSRAEPRTAQEPPRPEDVDDVDELNLIATYLQQYRHATRSPEPYWSEALRRRPRNPSANTAMGTVRFTRAEFAEAEARLADAADRLTTWTRTPRDGMEALYVRGLVLMRLGREPEAAAMFARASWDAAWHAPSLFALAALHARSGDITRAVRELGEVTDRHPDHQQSADALSALLRDLGESSRWREIVAGTLRRDPLDQWARDLAGLPLTTDAPTLLDIALEYARLGIFGEALRVLDLTVSAADHTVNGQVQVGPLAHYHRAALLEAAGHTEDAAQARASARDLPIAYCQASRLQDVLALEAALDAEPDDAHAALILGNWYYNVKRVEDAITAWSLAAEASDTAVIAFRNLGLAAYNHHGDPETARAHYARAIAMAPDDAKLLYEYDQLRARLDEPSAERLADLDLHLDLVDTRDDLSVERIELLTAVGRLDEARDVFARRSFQPWEGGEGKVLAAWDGLNLAFARSALEDGRPADAAVAIDLSLAPPVSLGESRHYLANCAELYLLRGDTLASSDQAAATAAWERAASFDGDFVRMSSRRFSEQTYWSILALRRLGRSDEADTAASALRRWVDEVDRAGAADVDFFATSLPSTLLFTVDLERAHARSVARLRQQLADLER